MREVYDDILMKHEERGASFRRTGHDKCADDRFSARNIGNMNDISGDFYHRRAIIYCRLLGFRVAGSDAGRHIEMLAASIKTLVSMARAAQQNNDICRIEAIIIGKYRRSISKSIYEACMRNLRGVSLCAARFIIGVALPSLKRSLWYDGLLS